MLCRSEYSSLESSLDSLADTVVVLTRLEQISNISSGSSKISSLSNGTSRSGSKAAISTISLSKRGLSEKASQRRSRCAYSASSSGIAHNILSYVLSSVGGSVESDFRSCARLRHLASASSWQAAHRNLFEYQICSNSHIREHTFPSPFSSKHSLSPLRLRCFYAAFLGFCLSKVALQCRLECQDPLGRFAKGPCFRS